MTDETLRAATTNNEFLRALGELVLAAARLEQLEISTVEPAEADSRLPLWSARALELLDERDRFIAAAAEGHDGSTIVRVTARDGSVIAGDAVYMVHLSARMTRHRGAGLAIGVRLAVAVAVDPDAAADASMQVG